MLNNRMVLDSPMTVYTALYMDVGVGMALHKVSVACKVGGRVFGVDGVLATIALSLALAVTLF